MLQPSPKPPGEDPVRGTRAIPVSFSAAGSPPGEDSVGSRVTNSGDASDDIENTAADSAAQPDGVGDDVPAGTDFLGLVRQCEGQALLYTDQNNRRAWSDSMRAFHNEHFIGSKYGKQEYRTRSKLFVPKTRGAIRKDNAAVAASLFNSLDAITCLAGDDGDPRQRASAAVMTELVNYRTDRTSGKASFPWFLVSMGARQDSLLTGVCLTKQYWKQEFRKVGTENVSLPDANGVFVERQRDVYTIDIDRPDMTLFPPENYIIDPAADWTNPAQSSSYVILKYPMTMEEVKRRMKSPKNPWHQLDDGILQSSVETTSYDTAVRRAREMGLDRLDETQTGQTFKIVWVYETFMRIDDEDWCFFSVGSKHYLTDPKPVIETYPEQYGERPLSLGYGALESHRIYPMAPAESWQPLQTETNDLRNLRLDAVKQNVMPITKIVRGRQIDVDQVRRRSAGTSIIVQAADDVTFEPAPPIQAAVVEMGQQLEVEFDDLAGVQNFGNVQQNNALGKTLGGLKLAAGSANATQEFDIRLWIETWATPALAQIVRLEQYYEQDSRVLGLCAQRAQLLQKHGISVIDDKLLEEEITIRVSVGLGAGDPQQRLAKFQSAAEIVSPLLGQTKEFQSGQVEIDWEAICTEVFGGAGYRDGGRRFFKINDQPPPNPMKDLQTQALEAKIAKDNQTGKAAMFTGLAALAKAALGKRALEADVVDMLMTHQREATDMGQRHGQAHNETILNATEHGHRHGLAIAEHRRGLANDRQQHANSDREFAHRQATEAQQPDDDGGQGAPQKDQEQSQMSPQEMRAALQQTLMGMLQSGQLEFTRDEDGRISGARAGQRALPPGAQPQYPTPAQ